MKETEFRARFYKSSNAVICDDYIIEKRTNGLFSKWKEVARQKKIGDTNAEKELAEYMKTYLNIKPANDDSAYVSIKRL